MLIVYYILVAHFLSQCMNSLSLSRLACCCVCVCNSAVISSASWLKSVLPLCSVNWCLTLSDRCSSRCVPVPEFVGFLWISLFVFVVLRVPPRTSMDSLHSRIIFTGLGALHWLFTEVPAASLYILLYRLKNVKMY